jgi:hypothetical protein
MDHHHPPSVWSRLQQSAHGKRTAILPIRDEIEDQTEAYDIPSLAMMALIHAQKVLFKDRRMT